MPDTSPPPRKRQRTFAVSSFGPQLMAVWLKGAREEVRLEFPNKKLAQQFQLRLQMLRGAMQREDHPHKELVQRARTSLRTGEKAGSDYANDPDGKRYALLVVYPADSQFDDVLKKAGVVVTENDAALLDNPETRDGAAPESPPLDLEPTPDPLDKYR